MLAHTPCVTTARQYTFLPFFTEEMEVLALCHYTELWKCPTLQILAGFLQLIALASFPAGDQSAETGIYLVI